MNKELKKQFQAIFNIINSKIKIQSQIELCKDSWKDFENTNYFINTRDINLVDLYNEEFKKVK